MVRRVLAGGPAYEQGLNTGDQVVAFNNMRATKDFVDARLAEKRPGDSISLTIFRFDDLSMLLIKLGSLVDTPYAIVPVPAPSEMQKRIYQSWLGAAWPQPSTTPTRQ
jgi:predicted metalloprotease with PDZ domain